MQNKVVDNNSLLKRSLLDSMNQEKRDKNLELINEYLLDTTGSSVISKNKHLIIGYLFSLCKLKNPEFLTLTLRIIDKIESDGFLSKIFNFHDNHKNNIFHILAFHDQGEILEHLLCKIDKDELSSDIDKLNSSKFNPLFLAIKNFNHEIVKKLGKFGCDLNAINKGFTPLQATIFFNDIEGFKTLIALGANPNGIKDSHENCLDIILSSSKYLNFFDLLIEFHLDKKCKIANINYIKDDGFSPLHYFINNPNSTTKIKDLIDIGANLNYRNPRNNYFCALHLLSFYNQIEMVKIVISNGADVNLKNAGNNSALHIAIARNNFEIVIELLKNGADKFSTNQEGFNSIDFCKFFFQGNIATFSDLPQDIDLIDYSADHRQTCREFSQFSNFKVTYRDLNHFEENYYLDQYLLYHCDNASRLDLFLDLFKNEGKAIDNFDSLTISPIHDLIACNLDDQHEEITLKPQSQIKLKDFQIKKASTKLSIS
jgi:ankyrin repeat protein